MDPNSTFPTPDWSSVSEDIFRSNLPDVEKVKQAFEWITNQVIEESNREIELRRAYQDQDALVKEQIKLSTLQYARSIFDECYRLLAHNPSASQKDGPR